MLARPPLILSPYQVLQLALRLFPALSLLRLRLPTLSRGPLALEPFLRRSGRISRRSPASWLPGDARAMRSHGGAYPAAR